jgi:hypothetical protein
MMGPIYSVQSRKQLSTCCSAVWLPSRCGVLCLNVLTSLSFLLMYTWPSAEVTKSSRLLIWLPLQCVGDCGNLEMLYVFRI